MVDPAAFSSKRTLINSFNDMLVKAQQEFTPVLDFNKGPENMQTELLGKGGAPAAMKRFKI